MARSDTIGSFHSIHPRDSRSFYEVEGSVATLAVRTLRPASFVPVGDENVFKQPLPEEVVRGRN